MAINAVRGEVELVVGDDSFTLCLTLGALSEIESGLGVDSIDELGEVFAKPKSSTIISLLLALVRGGGHSEVTKETIESWPLDIAAIMEVIKQVFASSGIEPEDSDTEGKSEKVH